MNTQGILLTKFLGIKRNNSNKLYLPVSDNVKNHLGTIHASAQFSLAELATGMYLEEIFPELKNKVVAVIRKSQVRYRAPGETELTAFASVEPEILNKLLNDLNTKKRGIVSVSVKLMDYCGKCIFEGVFEWHVTKLPD
jgi:hypothetical protein